MELVTGGAGFIGSHLVDALVERGQRVRVFDNFSSGREDFLSHHERGGMVEVVRGDLLDPEGVKEAMDGIETVHHLAANPDIRLGTEVTDTDLRQGTVATYNVLESMRVNGISRISFASSSAVYGEADLMPTPEGPSCRYRSTAPRSSPARPSSPHGSGPSALRGTYTGSPT